MKADFPALWAESPSTLRREPTNAEFASGFGCGPLDLPLFNELIYRLAQVYREAAYAVAQSGQTPNANNTGQLWTAIQNAAANGGSTYISSLSIVGGRLQFYSSAGVGTWVAPAGVTKVRAIGQAGGGAGGAGGGGAGAGGLGGNYFEGVFNVTPGAAYTVTIGAGGAPSSSAGGNGGSTAFGPQGAAAFAVALGGPGGNAGSNGSPGIAPGSPGASGIGFPNGGYELVGGYAQNGIVLQGVTSIGGSGGGSRFSPPSPNPYGDGAFSAPSYGGGGSGGAGTTPGGFGGGGLLILEF